MKCSGSNPLWEMIIAGAVVYCIASPTVIVIGGILLWLVVKTRR